MNPSDISNTLKDASLDILPCIQCGTCSGSCPSGRYTSLNTRRIIRGARVGRDVLHDKDPGHVPPATRVRNAAHGISGLLMRFLRSGRSPCVKDSC